MVAQEIMAAREELVEGQRRPWALERVRVTLGEEEVDLGLDLELHHGVIEEVFAIGLGPERDSLVPIGEVERGNAYLWSGLLEAGRLLLQNNHGEPASLGDAHAWQLKRLREASDFSPEHYAIVGAGADASLVINAAYLFDKETVIHVFERDVGKIADAKQTLRRVGLGSRLDSGKIQFIPGDANNEISLRAQEVGGFEGVDVQLLLQHLPQEGLNNFLHVITDSLRPGGLAILNEVAVGRWGTSVLGGHDENEPGVQEALAITRRYIQGDGTPENPGILKVGWLGRKASVWLNLEGFQNDIASYIGEALEYIPEFERSWLVREDVCPGHGAFGVVRYMAPTIARGVTAGRKIMETKSVPPAAIEKMKGMEDWAWEMGRAYDEVLMSPVFNEHLVADYPEFLGTVWVKR